MKEYDVWECFNAFYEQCPNDRSCMTDIFLRFRSSVIACGKHLLEKEKHWSFIIPSQSNPDKYLEFLEFLDGNGFIVKPINSTLYKIIPQYPESEMDLPKFDWE